MSDADITVAKAIHCEAALLGCFLLDNDQIAMERPVEGAFFDPRHEVVWARIDKIHRSGSAVDTAVLFDALLSAGEVDRAGGVAYVMGLANIPPSASMAGDYLRVVTNALARRKLEELALLLSADAGNEDVKVSLCIKRARAALEQLEGSDSIVDAAGAAKAAAEAVAALLGGIEMRVRTGLRSLDEITCGGLLRSTATVLAGRPGAGKTTTALQIMVNMARTGVPVAWFGLEMDLEQTSLKALENLSGCPIFTASPGLLEENRAALRQGAQALSGLPVYFDTTTQMVEDLCAGARRVTRMCRLRHGRAPVLIFDYIQIIKMAEPTGNQHQDIGAVMNDLVGLAKDLKTQVVVISMLNRAGATRKDRTPTMSDLKASGDIEQAAALIALLYEGEAGDEGGGDTAECQVLCEIPKSRFGKTGSIELAADFEVSRVW